jgi:hypothetical protein
MPMSAVEVNVIHAVYYKVVPMSSIFYNFFFWQDTAGGPYAGRRLSGVTEAAAFLCFLDVFYR